MTKIGAFLIFIALMHILFGVASSQDVMPDDISAGNITEYNEMEYILLSPAQTNATANISENITVANESDPIYWYNKGRSLQNDSRYNESIKAFDKAIELNQSYLEAWYIRGHILNDLGKFDEAVKSFDKIIEIVPDDAGTWFNKGNALLDQGKYEEAAKAYDAAIKIDSEITVISLYSKGMTLLSHGEYNKSIQAFNKVVEIKPDFAPAWEAKARVLGYLEKHDESTKCYDEAVRAYDKAIMLNTSFSDYFFYGGTKGNIFYNWGNKANILYNQGKYEEAIKAYDEVIRLDPNEITALSYKGYSLYSLGKFNEAIKSFDEAIKLDPNDTKILYYMGDTLSKLGRDYEAIKAYDEVIRIDPNYAEAWNNKGNTLAEQKKYDEAVEAFNEAIRLDPKDPQTWTAKGISLMMQGKYDEAIKAYDEAIKLDRNNADARKFKDIAIKAQGKQAKLLLPGAIGGMSAYKIGQMTEVIHLDDNTIQLNLYLLDKDLNTVASDGWVFFSILDKEPKGMDINSESEIFNKSYKVSKSSFKKETRGLLGIENTVAYWISPKISYSEFTREPIGDKCWIAVKFKTPIDKILELEQDCDSDFLRYCPSFNY